MKKIIKVSVIMLGIVIMLCASTIHANEIAKEDMAGDWIMEYKYEGTLFATQQVAVDESGTFKTLNEEDVLEGTWEITNDKLALTSDGETIELKWDDDNQNFTGNYSGFDIIMTKNDIDISEKNTEKKEAVVGGWSVAEESEINDDIKNTFYQAMDKYQDEEIITVSYDPVTYLGSQVVAGLNHAILCKCSEINKGTKWVIVYIYENLDGDAEVTDVIDVKW